MKNTKQKGFITLIILIIIALALAKYFYSFDVFNAAATPQGQQTTSYIKQIFDFIWSFIGRPLTFLWDNVIKGILFKVFLLGWDQLQSAVSHLPSR